MHRSADREAEIQSIAILRHTQSRGHAKRIDSENLNDHPSPAPSERDITLNTFVRLLETTCS
ncbi:hypothetical protein [Novipirellula rosea]|uniref:Uncharacterized protein n=1 Tax=Novipirellula rosea TaxID=1031540 RepID=A0ABP8NVQ9_9BACT